MDKVSLGGNMEMSKEQFQEIKESIESCSFSLVHLAREHCNRMSIVAVQSSFSMIREFIDDMENLFE